MSIRHARPEPQTNTDPLHWAHLFTRARLRKGWSNQRLCLEADLDYVTVVRACTKGHCHSQTILKLAAALGLIVIPPLPAILSAREAQYGR